MDTKVNVNFIVGLREEYQHIFEDGSVTIQVICGKFHKYLVMTFNYTPFGQMKITILDYIDEIIDDFDQ